MTTRLFIGTTKSDMDLNDLRKKYLLKHSEVFVERNLVCNVIENMRHTFSYAPVPKTS